MDLLLEATFKGSVLYIITAVLLTLVGRFFKPRLKLLMQLLVILRFMLPFSLVSIFSLYSLLPQGLDKTVVTLNESDSSVFTMDVVPSVTEKALLTTAELPEQMAQSFPTWLYLWVLGFSCFLLLLLRNIWNQQKLLKRGQLVRDRALLELLENCQQQTGVRCRVKLLSIPGLHSPALYGLWRPYILLPTHLLTSLSEDEMRHVLLHELMHYKKCDNYLNLVLAVIHAVHWFNPLIYMARRSIARTQEESCDQAVLELLDEHEAHRYGNTLITLLINPGTRGTHSTEGMSCFFKTKKHITRRIIMIQQHHRRRFAATLFSVTALASIACAGLTDKDGSKKRTHGDHKQEKANKGIVEESKRAVISSRFIQGAKKQELISSPKVITTLGQTAVIRIVEERHLPKGWDKAKTQNLKGKKVFVPALPQFGGPTDIGLSLQVTPETVQHPTKGEVLYLHGKITISEMVDSKVSQLGKKEKDMINHVVSLKTKSITYSVYPEKNKPTNISLIHEGKKLLIELSADLIDN